MPQKQPSSQDLIRVADALVPALQSAGEVILQLYAKPEHSVSTKSDLSPVTDADLASHELLTQALAVITPDWPVISEEDQTIGGSTLGPYWLLDPLDGTKEFIARTGEFSINLGLVVDHQAWFGLLYGPVRQILYRGGRDLPAQVRAFGETWRPIHCRPRPDDGGVLISSRRSAATPEGEVFANRVHLGSALKFAEIAQGNADFYLRRGPTMEWDTCAGQAILEAAGGSVTALGPNHQPTTIPLRYGKLAYLNSGFIARGG